MHRIDGAGHVNNQFVSEDPATNRPPTEVTAEILNALQEELASVVERTGRVLDKSNNTQVGDSIQNMIEARVGDDLVPGQVVGHPVYEPERKRAKES